MPLEGLCSQAEARWFYAFYSRVYESLQPYFTSDSMREAGLDLADVRGQMRVLDVGAGTGSLSKQVVRRVADASALTLLDQSEGMLSRARSKPELDGATFVLADAHVLPFDDGTFDRVVSSGVVYYFPDPVGAVREQMRVVRPGGRVLAMGSLRPKPLLIRLIATTFNRFPTEADYVRWFEQVPPRAPSRTLRPLSPSARRGCGAQAGLVDVQTRHISNPWNSNQYALAIVGTRPASGAPVPRATPPADTLVARARRWLGVPWALARFSIAMGAFAILGPMQVINAALGMRRLRNSGGADTAHSQA